jgi:hypothetical protein
MHEKYYRHFIIKLTYEIILLQNKLHGLLQATQESQNYASALNRGALNRLEDVIDSNKHTKSEPIDLKRKISESDAPQTSRKKGPHVSFSAISPHKPLLTKEMMAKYAPCSSCQLMQYH